MQCRQFHTSQHTRYRASSPPNTRALQPARCCFSLNANVAQLSSAQLVVCMMCLPAVNWYSQNFAQFFAHSTAALVCDHPNHHPHHPHQPANALGQGCRTHPATKARQESRCFELFDASHTRRLPPRQPTKQHNTATGQTHHTTNTQTHTHTHSVWSSPFRGRSSTWGSAGFSSPSS
jgi:hypothetical protein